MNTALETELTEENKNDKFKCTSCPKTSTREDILKIWTAIPFGKEENKSYYCGCMGWD